MREIWVPELIIAVFLVLYLIRPFCKGLWPVEGLVWLPLLSLAITIGIFPAYGFRSECIPLLFFELVLNIVNIPSLISSAVSVPNEDFRDRGPVFALPALVLLGGALLVMFAFSPKIPPGLAAGVEIRKIRDEARNRDYILRIYADDAVNSDDAVNGGIQPVLFLIPPEAGSIPAVDLICAGLRDRGFVVITYSRPGFDFPAIDENGRQRLVSPVKMRNYWRAFRAGTKLKKANDQGKILEAERLSDIEFLLPRILALADSAATGNASQGSARQGNPGETPLFLVGYGAGGSALIMLAGSAGFSVRNANVKGIAAVESRLWSVFRSDPPVLSVVSAGAPWHKRFRTGAENWFAGLKTRRITGLEPLPRPGIPLLCLVSDRALAPVGGVSGKVGGNTEENPYRALLETLRRSGRTNTALAPAAAAVIEGAGPLDYYAYPLSHPVYSFFFPGLKQDARKSTNPVEDTISVICNFAVMLLEQADAVPPLRIPVRRSIDADVYVETWGMAKFLP